MISIFIATVRGLLLLFLLGGGLLQAKDLLSHRSLFDPAEDIRTRLFLLVLLLLGLALWAVVLRYRPRTTQQIGWLWLPVWWHHPPEPTAYQARILRDSSLALALVCLLFGGLSLLALLGRGANLYIFWAGNSLQSNGSLTEDVAGEARMTAVTFQTDTGERMISPQLAAEESEHQLRSGGADIPMRHRQDRPEGNALSLHVTLLSGYGWRNLLDFLLVALAFLGTAFFGALYLRRFHAYRILHARLREENACAVCSGIDPALLQQKTKL